MRSVARSVRDERGQAVVMVALSLVAVIALAGLAIDVGRYFVVRAQLAKAVDGGALAGARVLPTGRPNAETAALEIAHMNFPPGYMNSTSHSFVTTFDPDPLHARVAVRGTADLPTTLLRVVGIQHSTVTAFAEAERRPLSIALVLDNSFSLDPSFAGIDAIGYLRVAAGNFVGYFDDSMDKMSLTLFSTGTVEPFSLGHNFNGSMSSTISGMDAVDFTNLSDGMISARQQLQSDTNQASYQAVVFFTDGRPTALRGRFLVDATLVDAVITGDQEPFGDVHDQLYEPGYLHRALPGMLYTLPQLPDGSARTVPELQRQATRNVLAAAGAARDDGVTVYTIGLGNPNNADSWKQPDARLLIQMANTPFGTDPETGQTIVNPTYDPQQPEGKFYFAPDATALAQIFEQVAQEIVLRLVQ